MKPKDERTNGSERLIGRPWDLLSISREDRRPAPTWLVCYLVSDLVVSFEGSPPPLAPPQTLSDWNKQPIFFFFVTCEGWKLYGRTLRLSLLPLFSNQPLCALHDFLFAFEFALFAPFISRKYPKSPRDWKFTKWNLTRGKASEMSQFVSNLPWRCQVDQSITRSALPNF